MIEAIGLYLLVTFFVYQLDPNPAPEGYTNYDPCIRCGEDWSFYPSSTHSKPNDNNFVLPQKMTIED